MLQINSRLKAASEFKNDQEEKRLKFVASCYRDRERQQCPFYRYGIRRSFF